MGEPNRAWENKGENSRADRLGKAEWYARGGLVMAQSRVLGVVSFGVREEDLVMVHYQPEGNLGGLLFFQEAS